MYKGIIDIPEWMMGKDVSLEIAAEFKKDLDLIFDIITEYDIECPKLKNAQENYVKLNNLEIDSLERLAKKHMMFNNAVRLHYLALSDLEADQFQSIAKNIRQKNLPKAYAILLSLKHYNQFEKEIYFNNSNLNEFESQIDRSHKITHISSSNTLEQNGLNLNWTDKQIKLLHSSLIEQGFLEPNSDFNTLKTFMKFTTEPINKLKWIGKYKNSIIVFVESLITYNPSITEHWMTTSYFFIYKDDKEFTNTSLSKLKNQIKDTTKNKYTLLEECIKTISSIR